MPPERFNAAARAVASGRTRRAALGSFLAAFAAAAKREDGGAGKGCKDRYSEKQLLQFIGKAAKKYGQSKQAMERVARCESNLNPCAVNREGPYYGLFQFLKSTWKSTPYGNKNIYDPKAQALAAAWMWKQGRKHEWACQ